MVTRHDITSSRWSTLFEVKIHAFFSTCFNNKVNLGLLLVAKIMQSAYLCVIFHVKHKKKYRKIPGAYIFQRPFLRGLFLEGLIFGGAYLRREICVSESIGLAL